MIQNKPLGSIILGAVAQALSMSEDEAVKLHMSFGKEILEARQRGEELSVTTLIKLAKELATTQEELIYLLWGQAITYYEFYKDHTSITNKNQN